MILCIFKSHTMRHWLTERPDMRVDMLSVKSPTWKQAIKQQDVFLVIYSVSDAMFQKVFSRHLLFVNSLTWKKKKKSLMIVCTILLQTRILLFLEDILLAEFMYLLFTHMPGNSYRRRLRSLLLYLCYAFRALINSLVCWFYFKQADKRIVLLKNM